jgi:hypothetical protein
MRHRSPTARPLALLGSIAALLLAPSAASANTITVDSNADPSAAGCTLHNAIQAANGNVAVNGCTAGGGASDVIDATGLAGQTITLAGPLSQITTNVDINGPGSGQLTVSGNDLVRPFSLNSAAVVNITGMTISHGRATFAGGIDNSGTLTLTDVAVINNTAQVTGGTNTFPEGGGILTAGTLHLVLSTVSSNTATGTGGTGQNAPAGGGIWNSTSGTVTIDRSTISGNASTAVAGAGGTTNANGAGIDNFGTLSVLRSTLSDNTVSGTASSISNSAAGGAIANANAAAVNVTIDRSTMTGNSASTDSPGAAQTGGFNVTGTSFSVTSSTIAGNSAPSKANADLGALATVENTIISNPLGGGTNCTGAATSQGFNLTDVAGCGFVDPTDQVMNPLLDLTLADNGGPTQTLLPQPNSPAIDKGLASGGETVDQRGLQRTWQFDIADASGGDGTDIGAVEVQGPVPTGTTPTSPGASGSPNVFGTVETGSTVELFNDGICGTPATSGPAATFISPGLIGGPVAAGASTTFSVRSTYGTATSVCSPTTISYTNSTVPPPPSGGGGGSVAPVVPDTSLSAKVRKGKHKATFTFSSTDPSATFMCKLDKAAFAACTSPRTVKHLRKGKHTFTVDAVNAAGPDPSPATFKFKLKR